MRTIGTLCTVAVLVAILAFWHFGTLSPCDALRQTVRQRDGLAAILPDSVVDLVLAGQYGALSPGRCLGILLEQQSAPKPAQATQQPIAPQATSPAPPFDPMQWAAKVTTQAAAACRAKRLRGELPSHAASAQCANADMIEAFYTANYRYMDLIKFFAAKRVELANKIDRGEMTEQQGQVETQKIYASIQATERQRDAAR